jgi:hypothetical protein
MNHLSIITRSLVGHTDFVISSGECGFNAGRGKIFTPVLLGGQFSGKIFYAASDSSGSLAGFTACVGSVNEFNVPVPAGFTPDWFGNIGFDTELTFGAGKFKGQMYATTWLSKTDYFLYIYDGANTLIESYKMGPLSERKATLRFASPFQNGFAVPADGIVNLEIVHPTQ